ncbi:MAG TPA: hypothetical protein P5081_05870 [Phycisphaerae bacterium]|nr:hypothetical protein [Phycisphaerae bacterium]HRW52394.1 hypothetical protein [Phycisphaerae bacterium]
MSSDIRTNAVIAAPTQAAPGIRADIESPSRAGWLRRSSTWDALVALKLLTFAAIIAIRPFSITHDCGLLLDASQRLLEGATPYVDFLEQNPPLIYYLLAIPVALAKFLGVNPIPVYLVMFWLIVVVATIVVRRLLSLGSNALSPLQRGLVLFSFVVASECTLLAPDFGQREHWFAITFAPLLLLRWLMYRDPGMSGDRRTPSMLLRVLIGVAAGVGAALKHHFLLIWVGVELLCALRTRAWRKMMAPETIAAGIFLVVYLAHFAFVPPAMRSGFFERWAPFVLSHYWVYDQPISAAHIAFVSGVLLVYGGAALAAWRVTRRDPGASLLATMFATFTLLAITSFIVQRKDYSYHLIPVYFGALPCMALWAGARVTSGVGFGARLASLALIGVALGTAPSSAAEIALSWTIGRGIDEPTPIWREVLSRSNAGDEVLFISTNVGDAYPELIRYGYKGGSRYLVSMPIALVHSDLRAAGDMALYHDDTNRPQIELQYLRELAADVEASRPRLIAIVDQTSCQGCAPGFNVHAFLNKAGFIREEMASYEDLGVFEGKVSKIRLYVRRSPGEAGGATAEISVSANSLWRRRLAEVLMFACLQT